MVSVGNEHALALYDLGLTVVPMDIGKKMPTDRWKKHQAERPSRALTAGWFKGGDKNVFALTGRASGIVVLDCDNQAAVDWWHDRIGAEMDATACVQTSKGWHFWFKLAPEMGPVRSQAQHPDAEQDGPSWDIQGEGKGVVAPPSVHPSGWVYRWERGIECIVEAPVALLEAKPEPDGPDSSNVRSTFANQMRNPPVGENSGRNNWLTSQVGHLIHGIPWEDAALEAARLLNRDLETPLPDEELPKMVASILSSERAARAAKADLKEPDLGNGWLVSGQGVILIQVMVGRGEETSADLAHFLENDIRALGVASVEGYTVYDVDMVDSNGQHQAALLPAAVLSEDRALNKWLAGYRIGINLPSNASPKMPAHERLRRYMEAQDPALFEMVDTLGWNGSVFLCHEGAITAQGHQQHGPFRIDPRLTFESAPYTYGFKPADEALQVLREVMTFQDETIAAVIGAWWAASLLKPQIEPFVSQFPILALEGLSGSGKSTGFIPAIVQLAGAPDKPRNVTGASFRDAVAGHRSGIVWVDDKDDPTALFEVMRAATVGGVMEKKGVDNTTQVRKHLVAPIIIGGEYLGLSDQKAMADRTILLCPPPVKNRRSLVGDHLQWVDVMRFEADHPDLNQYAGTLVQLVLGLSHRVADMRQYMATGSGRFGDKMAVLRLGARVMADMLGDESMVDRVEEWIGQQVDPGDANSLLNTILPQLLRSAAWPSGPELGDGDRVLTTPVWRDPKTGQVAFNDGLVAEAWRRRQPGRVVMRTESEEAITQQRVPLKCEKRRMNMGERGPRSSPDGRVKMSYWYLDEHFSEVVLADSGWDRDIGPNGPTGAVPTQQRLDLTAYTNVAYDPDQVPDAF